MFPDLTISTCFLMAFVYIWFISFLTCHNVHVWVLYSDSILQKWCCFSIIQTSDAVKLRWYCILLQMSKEQALRRWNILADVIKSKNCKTEFDGSKRSFQSYNIFRVEPIDDDEDNSSDSSWKMVSFKDTSVAVRWWIENLITPLNPPFFIRYLSSKLNLDQLIGFNNTGNVCVWPSEESLAVYCLNNLQLFQVERISLKSFSDIFSWCHFHYNLKFISFAYHLTPANWSITDLWSTTQYRCFWHLFNDY